MAAPANRGSRQLLRNGLDYLQTYNDPVRASRFLEQANAGRAELTPEEQASLDAALATVQTQLVNQSVTAGGELPALPPRPQTAQMAQSAASALPALPVLNPVPQTVYGPEDGVVRTSGEVALEPEPNAEPASSTESEAIGLTVLTDPADHLAGLGSSDPATDTASTPLPALPVPAAPAALEAPTEPLPSLAVEPVDPAAEAPIPLEAQVDPAAEAPIPLEAQVDPAAEAPIPLEAAEPPPALPALPGPALEAEPEILSPPPLAAPAARNAAVPPVNGAIPPVLPADASLAVPTNEALPEDSGLILEPPVDAAPAMEPLAEPVLPVLPGNAEASAPISSEAPPLELGAPASVGLPELAPNPAILNAAAAPTGAERPSSAEMMGIEPPPAPDASELPGIDLSVARPGAPPASANSAPIVDPAPTAQPVPFPHPWRRPSRFRLRPPRFRSVGRPRRRRP